MAEGTIKFCLHHREGALRLTTEAERVCRALLGWRHVLKACDLVGQQADRYDGLGYGNLSGFVRTAAEHTPRAGADGAGADSVGRAGAAGGRPFLITGTQTSGLTELTSAHFALVEDCEVARNAVSSSGLIEPSSEALTHGAVYALSPQIGVVFHVHSAALWQAAQALELPITDVAAACGTPELAGAIQHLYAVAPEAGVIAMGGHEDGIVAFGPSADVAGSLLLSCLARAWALAPLRA